MLFSENEPIEYNDDVFNAEDFLDTLTTFKLPPIQSPKVLNRE